MKKRSLADLYVRGTSFTLDDGEGEVVVWLQKLNPVERSAALKAADAARSRVLSMKRSPDSEEYQQMASDVLRASKEALVSLLVATERARITPLAFAEVADLAEWKDDNYLSGLQDAWAEDLSKRFEENPEDAEAKVAHDALEKYADAVEEKVDDELSVFTDGIETMPDEEIEEMAIQQSLKTSGDVAWLSEFYRQEVFYAVRDPDNHKSKMFTTRSEVDDLQGEVFSALTDAIHALSVDPTEGKDSAETPPSSPSSDQSAAEETSNSSGQQAA
jgi:hypothetical protein